MFKTTGKVNKEFFNKIKACVFPPKAKYVFAFMVVLCIFYSIFTFYMKRYDYTAIFVVFLLAIVLEYYLLRNRTIKVNLKRMVEMVGKEEFEYTVFFEDDGVVMQNHSTGASCKIPFGKFARLAKNDSAYALFTKSNQMIPIFVDCLSNSEKDELVSFLKAKNPKLK